MQHCFVCVVAMDFIREPCPASLHHGRKTSLAWSPDGTRCEWHLDHEFGRNQCIPWPDIHIAVHKLAIHGDCGYAVGVQHHMLCCGQARNYLIGGVVKATSVVKVSKFNIDHVAATAVLRLFESILEGSHGRRDHFTIVSPKCVQRILQVFTQPEELPQSSPEYPFLDQWLNNVAVRHVRFKLKPWSRDSSACRSARHWAYLASYHFQARHALHFLNGAQARMIDEYTLVIRDAVNQALRLCPAMSVDVVYHDMVACAFQAIAQGFFYGYGGPPVSERERQPMAHSSAFAYRNLAIAQPFYFARTTREFFENVSFRDCKWVDWAAMESTSTCVEASQENQ